MFTKLLLPVFLILLCCGNSNAGVSFFENNKADQDYFFTIDYTVGIMVSNLGDRFQDNRLSASLDLGLLKKISKRGWLGGSVQIVMDPDDTRLGLRARYRHQLTRLFSFDLSPGIMLTQIHGPKYWDDLKRDYPTIDIYTQLNIGRFFGLRVRFDHFSYQQVRNAPSPLNEEPFYREGSLSEFHIGIVTKSYVGSAFLVVTSFIALVLVPEVPPVTF